MDVTQRMSFSSMTRIYLACLTSQHIFASSGAEAIMLKPQDIVGMSFWFISMALVASTAFFFLEVFRVSDKWKTSLIVSGLVTLVASVHYFYMREVWVLTQEAPTVYRYIDWLITVPLLIAEFYLILSAVTQVHYRIMVRLLLGTLIMLLFGFVGEAGFADVWISYTVGMLGWGIILYEIFLGEASRISASQAPKEVQQAFSLMRLIVTFGWSIYPIGYFFGYLVGTDPQTSMKALNIIYNLGDLLNKITFGIIIWSLAVQETDAKKVKST